MSEVIVLPDAVALVIHALRADSVLGPVAIGTRQAADPMPAIWLKVQRIGGSPRVYQRLDRAFIQIDSFANSDEAAMTLARRAYGVCWSSPGFSDSQGLIAGVEPMQGLQNLPDSSRTPPTPRITFTLIFTTRPV